MDLQPFQKRFIKQARNPAVLTCAYTLPRANGKSWLAAYIAAQELQRISRHEEIALCAASIEQGRIVFRFIRQMLGDDGWRYLDSATRCAITRSDGARLRVIGSNGKTAMGLVDTPPSDCRRTGRVGSERRATYGGCHSHRPGQTGLAAQADYHWDARPC